MELHQKPHSDWYGRRAGRLVRVAPGCCAESGEWRSALPSERYEVAVRGEGRNHLLTGRSVAALLGLPLLTIPQEVDIGVMGRGHVGVSAQPELPFAARRSLCSGQEVMIDGLRCAPAAEALAKSLSMLPFRDGLVLADACARRREGLGDLRIPTLGQIERALEQAPWKHGRRRARESLRYASPMSESVGESLSRAILIEFGLPLPRLQPILVMPSGREYRPDCYWEEFGLIGEFDGLVKYSGALAESKGLESILIEERRREIELMREGLDVLRWLWKDLMGPEPPLVGMLRDRLKGKADVFHPGIRRNH